jgi:tetratricopeptide (TPR) repeat protein
MRRFAWLVIAVAAAVGAIGGAQDDPRIAAAARVTEEVRTLTTYPFSEPDPIPMLARDARLYPYHSFEGYSHESVPREWKVVRLENDLIEVFVLPQIGGKVWGARVKKTGHEFIYRNEAVKFRNIALRGPWTSGGIEFNFGVIGHAPWTASPVDYVLRENADGSVSCVVGTMDLPSRTEWRVEIRLQAGRAAFETNVLWHNPTPIEQPYYNWMTAAAVARGDLELSYPGDAYLQHSGAREAWPVDDRGRNLAHYRSHTFGGHKSFHVVGELQDFFGGYYRDAGYGFGHWARHEDMPGRKLWLWSLSRSGGIWEDLLTDADGQYIEFQAGRLLVQYSPGGDVNPISEAGFEPYATDRWSETWFPIEGLGGLTDASPEGAIAIREEDGGLRIAAHAFGAASDTLRVWSGEKLVEERPIAFEPLVPVTTSVRHSAGTPYRVELAALGIDYHSDPADRTLSRPFEADPTARASIPEADRLVFDGRELARARRHNAARPLFESALAKAPWHRGALVAMADLEYRRARYRDGLVHALRALRLDTYDPGANFVAGNLFRALGRAADARDAFGWAARSMAFRSAANVQLAELALARSDLPEAERYARIALDYNRLNLTAWDLLAIVGRATGDRDLAATAANQLSELDPLHHLLRAETYLSARTPAAASELLNGLRSEYPDQTILELAAGYANRGRKADAIALFDAAAGRLRNPLLRAWRAYLAGDPSAIAAPADVAFVFPYRRETLAVLEWAARESRHWTWTYLHALNLWALDRPGEAEQRLRPLGTTPDSAAFYVTRATLIEVGGGDPESDLVHADRLAANERTLRIPLIAHYQAHGRWTEALAGSTRARQRFPGDFTLDLLHARSLVHLERPDEAIGILDRTRVLPSEHARASHQLFVQAHIMAALTAIEGGRLDAARTHLDRALEWPEHLGQGNPYDPEERLIRFLIGRVEARRGRTDEARRSFEAVAAATAVRDDPVTRLDLLAVPALRALGRAGEARAILSRAKSEATRRDVSDLAEALERDEILAGPAPRESDLDGALLSRALRLPAR